MLLPLENSCVCSMWDLSKGLADGNVATQISEYINGLI